MSEDYSEFMRTVMEYAVDSAPEAAVTLAGREVAQLTEKVFVNEFYVKWPDKVFEEGLYQRMLTSTQLTCVAAYRGCGKTSALCHVVSRIAEEHVDTVRPVIIDIKQLYDDGVFSPLTDNPTPEILSHAYQIFKTEIRRVVQMRLLPGPANTIRILAWALAGPPDATDRFVDFLVAGVIDLSDRAVMAAHAISKTRRERMAAIAHSLESDERFETFHDATMEHLTAAHIVRAGMAIRGWKRVVLVFDNIDRIPISYQIKFMEAVNDAHNALAGACGTVVAIRRETLRRHAPRANEKGDPIDIIAPNAADYPPLLFPNTQAAHVRGILQRRHDYCIKLYQNNTLNADVEIQKVIALHSSVVDEFVRDSIHALANGSIRALAKIYTGFFRYVHRAESANITRGQDPRNDEGHLQTLFFLFLRDNAKDYGLIYYEIVRSDADFATSVTVPDLASPHHLILTALLNLTKDLPEATEGENGATFQQLVQRVKQLGFDFETIREAIDEMHADTGEPPRTIEFTDSDPDISKLQENSQLKLRLTPLGHVLVTSLLHKVGYIWGQAYDGYIRSSTRKEATKLYYELDAGERVQIFFSYVRDLALAHLKLLSLVRAELQNRYKLSWLVAYRAQFGVSEQFQVQRLCASAAAFYQPHFNPAFRNPFSVLRQIYDQLVDDLVRGVEHRQLDVNRLSGRIEDFYRRRSGGR